MTAYAKPPILEAVLEIQFSSDPLSNRDMERLAKKLERKYPHSEIMRDYTFSLKVNSEGVAKEARPDLVQQWYKCIGNDASDLCNIRPKSLVTARLTPYLSWEKLFESFEADFEVFRKVCGYKKITRFATRFINRIDVSSDGSVPVDPRRYLNLYPSAPGVDYDSLATHFVKLQHVEPSGASVILQAGQLDPVLINKASMLLDIDVFVDKDIPVKIDEVLASLNALRNVKNRVFERLVTDEARMTFR
ncbi:TIGR04255 family protein [Ensifer sp. NPDC090286]|uniref:TIGR04255 family protein n=1 Tax=Ensifer sp. NPDC090286 TaxID=3363991 RepID=UPI00383B61B5